MRHSSASSSVSVDQGYISASPGAGEVGPSVFSPPTHHHHRSFFSFHNSSALGNRTSSSFHAPSTSPLPEIPDDSVCPQFTSSNRTDTSPVSHIGVFTPPTSPDSNNNALIAQSHPRSLPASSRNHYDQMQPSTIADDRQVCESDVQAMSAYIHGILRNKNEESPLPCNPNLPHQGFSAAMGFDNSDASKLAKYMEEEALLRMQTETIQLSWKDRVASSAMNNFSSAPFSPSSVPGNFLEECRRRTAMSSSWSNGMVPRVDDLTSLEHRHPGTNAQVLLALRQKEQMETERRDMNKILMNAVSPEEAKAQVYL